MQLAKEQRLANWPKDKSPLRARLMLATSPICLDHGKMDEVFMSDR